MPHIIVTIGPDKGRSFNADCVDQIIVGRSSTDLALTDRTASRQHCKFKVVAGRWYVHDLKATHGTFVNDKKVEGRTFLSDGDKIKVGATYLRFFVASCEERSSDDYNHNVEDEQPAENWLNAIVSEVVALDSEHQI